MKQNETEENENLTFKDVVVLSAAATATIIGVGALARLGYDLADEGLRKYKSRKAQKSQTKSN
jgi:hypothetical protein